MAHIYHVRYNAETLISDMISGSPIFDIPNGFKVCKVSEQDGEDFMLSKKFLHQYLVTDVNGYAVFTPRTPDLLVKKFNVADDVVRDLDYRLNFIDTLNIKYTHCNNILTLHFDIDKLQLSIRNNFLMRVTEENNLGFLYVTMYRDPTKLHIQLPINFHKLSLDKTVSFNIDIDGKISVWASKG